MFFMKRVALVLFSLTLILSWGETKNTQILYITDDNLETLYSKKFNTISHEYKSHELIKMLQEKNVIDSQYIINHERVRALAKSDISIIKNGYYFTQTEIELYSLANLLYTPNDIPLSRIYTLYKPEFKDMSKSFDQQKLLAKLMQKHVINAKGVVNDILHRTLQKGEEAIEHNNKFYSPSQVEVFSLADYMHRNSLVLLDNIDVVRGDLKAMNAKDLNECIEHCNKLVACKGFTYVKDSHPTKSKHNKCYLKSFKGKNVYFRVDSNYTSGKKMNK